MTKLYEWIESNRDKLINSHQILPKGTYFIDYDKQGYTTEKDLYKCFGCDLWDWIDTPLCSECISIERDNKIDELLK